MHQGSLYLLIIILRLFQMSLISLSLKYIIWYELNTNSIFSIHDVWIERMDHEFYLRQSGTYFLFAWNNERKKRAKLECNLSEKPKENMTRGFAFTIRKLYSFIFPTNSLSWSSNISQVRSAMSLVGLGGTGDTFNTCLLNKLDIRNVKEAILGKWRQK